MNLRLGFSIAIHSGADIFLIDEILAVGDEEFKKKSSNSIKELLKRKETLLIVSHDLEKLTELTSKIIMLKNGLIVKLKFHQNQSVVIMQPCVAARK